MRTGCMISLAGFAVDHICSIYIIGMCPAWYSSGQFCYVCMWHTIKAWVHAIFFKKSGQKNVYWFTMYTNTLVKNYAHNGMNC